jgi:hypothetical protein
MSPSYNPAGFMKVVVSLVLISFLAIPALASSVLQVSFEQLVRSSELVFEGRVVDRRAEADSRGVIKTHVTFEIVDVYKGSISSRTIDLPYLGGTVGDLTMQVSDLEPPAIGERGIYFVESIGNPPAHPLYGWEQGHFLIRQADRVFSHGGKAVLGLQPVAARATGLSTGVAAGLMVGEVSSANPGLTVQQFKQKVKEVLNTR